MSGDQTDELEIRPTENKSLDLALAARAGRLVSSAALYTTGGRVMELLLLATGFTGAYALLFLLRTLYHKFRAPPSVAVHFSPKGGCTDTVVDAIKGAHHEILVLAYSFTSRPISQ